MRIQSRRPMVTLLLVGSVLGAMGLKAAQAEKMLAFAGYKWQVRNATLAGPGPNVWDENNVWLDEQGRMHLKISQRDGQWRCAEVQLEENLGFGRYQWEIMGRPDQYDPQLVLGLFNYTRPEVGPDGTNEIDIEFARWGKAATAPGNFSVWPAVNTVHGATHAFDFKLDGTYTTERFDWAPDSVGFQMLGGHRDDAANPIAQWKYAPPEPTKAIPQQPLPIHLNFWLFQGKPPQNGQEAEVIISRFSFTPLNLKAH